MPRFRPPVICSSKDACFLCSSFVLIYRKIHAPRCYGRLYPGWRLPLLSKPNDLQRRFNEILKGCIKQSLSTLMLRRQKTRYPFPNESTLLTLALSETTKGSSVQLKLNRQSSFLKESDKNSRTILSDTGASHTSPECSNYARPYSPTVSDFVEGKDTLKPEYSLSASTHQSTSIDVLSDRRALFQGLVLSYDCTMWR